MCFKYNLFKSSLTSSIHVERRTYISNPNISRLSFLEIKGKRSINDIQRTIKLIDQYRETIAKTRTANAST